MCYINSHSDNDKQSMSYKKNETILILNGMNSTHTASPCVENSTIALPFFFLDTNSTTISPYCQPQIAK